MTDHRSNRKHADAETIIVAEVKRRFGLPLTQRETGALLGCSREMVRRHERAALDKIRAVLEQEGWIAGSEKEA